MGDWLPPLIPACFSPPIEVGVISRLIFAMLGGATIDQLHLDKNIETMWFLAIKSNVFISISIYDTSLFYHLHS